MFVILLSLSVNIHFLFPRNTIIVQNPESTVDPYVRGTGGKYCIRVDLLRLRFSV